MIAGSIEIQILTNLARLQSDMERANRTVNKAMSGIEASARMAVRALGGIVGVLSIRELANAADSYTKLTAQLKLATRSANEYAEAYGNVQRISKTAQADINATAALYSRLSMALTPLGANQEQIARITETVSLALKAGGATAQEAASAMLQLAQAFGSGKLAGDEFRAMSENAPKLMMALADSLNVPVGALKQMATEGKLTSDVLGNAFKNPELLQSLRNQAEQMNTISGAVVVLKNNFTTMIGEMDKANGASKAIAGSILFLADKMAFLADIVYGAVEVFKQFGRSLAVVFNDIETFGKIAGMAQNIFYAILNKDKIADLLKQRQEFTKAANEDLDKFLNGNFRRFRDAMAESRAEAAKPYDDKPLKAFGVTLDETANKAEKLASKQKLKDLQDEIDFEEEMRQFRIEKEFKAAQEIKEAEIKAAQDRADAIMKINQQISDEYLRTVKEQNEKAQREYDRFYDRLSQSITDALFRGFESGKSFIQNFKDTLIRAFQTLVLQPQIDLLVRGSGIGALFGVPNIANAGGVTSGGGIGNIFSTIKDGLSSLNTNVVGSIEKLGVFLSNGQGGLGDTLGGAIGQYSSQIASALAFTPAVFSLLQGDLKSAAFQGAGAAIGTAIGGPVGGAIGSFLGGAVGGLFGGKKNPRYTTAMTSVYGKNGLISSGQVNADGKDTNMFAGNLTALNNQFAKAVGTVYGLFDKDLKRLQIDSVFSYKKGKQTIGHTTGTIDGKFFGFGAQGFGKDISQGFAAFAQKMMGEGLAMALRSSTLPADVRRAFRGVVSSSVISAIVNAFGTLNNTLTVFEDKLNVTNLQLIAAANRTGMTGNKLAAVINGFSTDLANFYNLYYTDAEKITDVNKALTKQFEALNLTLPTSKEAFRAIVEGIDTTTVAGQDLFTNLLKLSPAFAQYMDAMNAQDQALQSQTEKLKDLAAALDPRNFRTGVDFRTAKAFIQGGVSLDQLPQSSFAVGTNYVPNDMTARIHKGERIIPAADNAALMQHSADLVTEIRSLRDEVASMRAAANDTARTSKKTADILTRVTRDGNSLLTEAA